MEPSGEERTAHDRRGRGAVVNTASENASLPDPLGIDDSAAKAPPVNFSKALSKKSGHMEYASIP
jgi:hypothetical protein